MRARLGDGAPDARASRLAVQQRAEARRAARRCRGARTRRRASASVGEVAHRLAVRADGAPHDRGGARASRTRCSRPATSRLAARRLTSHSHGPGQGLVEVVDVEDQVALGRRRRRRSSTGARRRRAARRRPESGVTRGRRPSAARRRGSTRTATRASGRAGSAPAPGCGSAPAPRAGRRDRRGRPAPPRCRGATRGTSSRAARPRAARSAIVGLLTRGRPKASASGCGAVRAAVPSMGHSLTGSVVGRAPPDRVMPPRRSAAGDALAARRSPPRRAGRARRGSRSRARPARTRNTRTGVVPAVQAR